ncbi:MAG: hypothetical protein M3261_06345 [Thermoproteota archaeon]|nr:hypothetical protein [Thermoproteota archaeon]
MPATISKTAMVNMVSLISTTRTTTKKSIENISKPVAASSRSQQQQAIIMGIGGRI